MHQVLRISARRTPTSAATVHRGDEDVRPALAARYRVHGNTRDAGQTHAFRAFLWHQTEASFEAAVHHASALGCGGRSPYGVGLIVDGGSGVPAICMRVRYRVAVTGW